MFRKLLLATLIIVGIGMVAIPQAEARRWGRRGVYINTGPVGVAVGAYPYRSYYRAPAFRGYYGPRYAPRYGYRYGYPYGYPYGRGLGPAYGARRGIYPFGW